MVSGALRAAKADVSEMHRLDGLRLAVELKPVNLAVGRAIWNRFGDIRTFAVNIHLKFPFAVVGGVLVVPTSEESAGGRKSTKHLISRAVNRLVRAGGRRTEGDAPHLLEGSPSLCTTRSQAASTRPSRPKTRACAGPSLWKRWRTPTPRGSVRARFLRRLKVRLTPSEPTASVL
jgi:hypothetical protein